MDTFKGQDNAEIKELYSKNECDLVIVPHNLSNNFQPLYTLHLFMFFLYHYCSLFACTVLTEIIINFFSDMNLKL